MAVLGFAIDDAVALLGDEQTEGNGQVVLEQSVFEPLGGLLGHANLAEVGSFGTQQLAALHGLHVLFRHPFHRFHTAHFVHHFLKKNIDNENNNQ